MKTAGRRNPHRWATVPCTPSLWRGRSELLLDRVGWEARKTPAAGEVFLLDFPLYRTYRDLAGLRWGDRSEDYLRFADDSLAFMPLWRRLPYQLTGHYVTIFSPDKS
jgi:hypothetical protein